MGRRWNKFWIGLALGILLPLVAFMLIYYFGYPKIHFDKFISHVVMMKALPKMLSLCAIPNLAIFYLFLNREYWYATRGIITATLLCTFVVLVIKLFA